MDISNEEAYMIDKITGCFLGGACGDALGAGVEFESAETISHRFPFGLTDFVEGSPFGFQAGDITDDTEQAILLAEALLENEKLNGGDEKSFWEIFGSKLIQWRHTAKDCGNQTGQGIRMLAQGAQYQDMINMANQTRPTNGAVMRVYPVALMYRNNPEKLVQFTRLATAITHPHPTAIDCALIVNMFIYNALKIKDNTNYCSLVFNNNQVFNNLWTPSENSNIRNICSNMAENTPTKSYTLATEAVAVARHIITSLRYSGDAVNVAENAIIQACSFGGDNDTHGAVTGAVAGSIFGADNLPARWLKKLKVTDQIIDLAEQIYTFSNTDSDSNTDSELLF